jgi:hypothetical protein
VLLVALECFLPFVISHARKYILLRLITGSILHGSLVDVV